MPKSWLVRGAESAERARRRMQLLGVTPNGFPLWEPREVEPVARMYPDYGSIFPRLDRRTHPAVYNKAARLGITRPRSLPWSDNEILRLRKVYPKESREEILAAFPGRSYGAIAKASNTRGVYRARRSPAKTGFRLLDQVLVRAQKMNLSMADLDALARCGSYFKRRGWTTHADERFHYLAARALGGTVRADFK